MVVMGITDLVMLTMVAMLAMLLPTTHLHPHTTPQHLHRVLDMPTIHPIHLLQDTEHLYLL